MPGSVSSGTMRSGYRSEEHTSELQSQSNLVCRLLLEKKKSVDADRPGPRRQREARTVGGPPGPVESEAAVGLRVAGQVGVKHERACRPVLVEVGQLRS